MTALEPVHEATGTTRRTVLRATGVVALAGAGVTALASCAAESTSGAPSTTPAEPATSEPASSSPAAESTSAKPSASKAQAPKGPSVATSKVPVGGGVILADADYVVRRATIQGQLHLRGTIRAVTETHTFLDP